MKYPYFRGLEADRYSFYRVPKALIKVDLFEKMSGDAKLLYAVLLDRMNLSLKNGWQDENGNAYIICTIDEIMDSIRCARQKAVKLLDELEHEYQLVERRRQGLGKPNLLYVKDLYQIKNSLAPTAEDIRFSISADKGFQWLECRPQSFENQKPDRKPEFESEQQKAVYWIKHFLEKGDMSANEIYCRLDNEGVSKRVARMVKTEMGIHCYQKKRRWYWSVQPEEGAVNGPQV